MPPFCSNMERVLVALREGIYPVRDNGAVGEAWRKLQILGENFYWEFRV